MTLAGVMTTPPVLPSTSPAPIRLRSPGEIASAVPHLLGFAPVDSLVLISLRGKRMGLTCRVDLTDLTVPGTTEVILGALERDGATSVIVVAYGTQRASTKGAIVHIRVGLEAADLPIQEELSIVGGRWFHERCGQARCCPPEGTPVSDHDLAPATMALAAAKGGFHGSREELAALVAPDRPLFRAAIRSEVELAEMSELLDNLVEDIVTVLGWGDGEPPTPAQVARTVLACSLTSVRDTWYSLVAPGMLVDVAGEDDAFPTDSPHHQRLVAAGMAAGDLSPEGFLLDAAARDRVLIRLREWVRNLPDAELPTVVRAPFAIAAMAHWCAGDGALARELVERATALDARPLGIIETLQGALARGLRPPHLGWLAPQLTRYLSTRRPPGVGDIRDGSRDDFRDDSRDGSCDQVPRPGEDQVA